MSALYAFGPGLRATPLCNCLARQQENRAETDPSCVHCARTQAGESVPRIEQSPYCAVKDYLTTAVACILPIAPIVSSSVKDVSPRLVTHTSIPCILTHHSRGPPAA